MSRVTTAWIRQLIAEDKLWKFYKTKEWRRLKERILEEQHHECAVCKKRGRVTRYDESRDGSRKLISTVHHVNEVRYHPELALQEYDIDSSGRRRRNLIPVCKHCHNEIHDRIFRGSRKSKDSFTNTERW